MKFTKLVIFIRKITNFFFLWDFAYIFIVNCQNWYVLSGELIDFDKKDDDFFAPGETEVTR